jgi:hypothetical protein
MPLKIIRENSCRLVDKNDFPKKSFVYFEYFVVKGLTPC